MGEKAMAEGKREPEAGRNREGRRVGGGEESGGRGAEGRVDDLLTPEKILEFNAGGAPWGMKQVSLTHTHNTHTQHTHTHTHTHTYTHTQTPTHTYARTHAHTSIRA